MSLVITLHPEAEWPALYSTQRKRNVNPHEFMRLVNTRAFCRTAIEPPKPSRYSITDIWDINGKRRTSLLRRIEDGDVSTGAPVPAILFNATDHLGSLGQCLVHPVIEIDFVAAPDLHRYPHLRKFCSMVDFDMLSPQRVVAFYTTVRLFPTRWKEIFRYSMRTRALVGAARYNQLFAWPSSAELLEIAEAYREYFRPSNAVATVLGERYRPLLEALQSLACQVFLTESRNDGFRLILFLGAVLRPCVGEKTVIIDNLFAHIAEARLSCARANRTLLDAIKQIKPYLENDDISALIAEFRLPRRKYSLIYPRRTALQD
jgi:hypothetical protein